VCVQQAENDARGGRSLTRGGRQRSANAKIRRVRTLRLTYKLLVTRGDVSAIGRPPDCWHVDASVPLSVAVSAALFVSRVPGRLAGPHMASCTYCLDISDLFLRHWPVRYRRLQAGSFVVLEAWPWPRGSSKTPDEGLGLGFERSLGLGLVS